MSRYLFLLFMLGLILCSCKEDRLKRDAGEITAWRNGAPWNCKANTTYRSDEEGRFQLTLYNTFDENPAPWGRMAIRDIPFEVSVIDLRSFEPQQIYPTASYTHTILYETSNYGSSSLWEDYPETHFEITYLSKNQRQVEGFFKLAFIVDDTLTTEFFDEPDTSYFEGSFEVVVRK